MHQNIRDITKKNSKMSSKNNIDVKGENIKMERK
jgi:hypothetical protein